MSHVQSIPYLLTWHRAIGNLGDGIKYFRYTSSYLHESECEDVHGSGRIGLRGIFDPTHHDRYKKI